MLPPASVAERNCTPQRTTARAGSAHLIGPLQVRAPGEFFRNLLEAPARRSGSQVSGHEARRRCGLNTFRDTVATVAFTTWCFFALRDDSGICSRQEQIFDLGIGNGHCGALG